MFETLNHDTITVYLYSLSLFPVKYMIYKAISTHGCCSRSATEGRPFLHASVVRIDSITEPKINK